MKITIKCKQEQHYEQEVDVTESDYEKLKFVDGSDITESHNPEEYALIESLIDFNYILDSTRRFESFEVIDE